MKKCYKFEGSICRFSKAVVNNWVASTQAETKAKAISNFKFQAKNVLGLIPSAKVELVGKIEMREG